MTGRRCAPAYPSRSQAERVNASLQALQCQRPVEYRELPRPTRHGRCTTTERATASGPLCLSPSACVSVCHHRLDAPPACQVTDDPSVRSKPDACAITAAIDRTRPTASGPAEASIQSLSVTSFRLRFFAESCLTSSAGGRGVPNPSPPLKLHLLSKCANTTKCTPPCACVLAFSQLFFSKELATQLATPVDPSNDVKLDHSSGTR
jgi:hypothetical protein